MGVSESGPGEGLRKGVCIASLRGDPGACVARRGSFDGFHGGGVLRTACLAFGLFHAKDMKEGELGNASDCHGTPRADMLRREMADGYK